MIWRLTYCNKDGVEARLDIIRGASTPVEVIEGTATPFVLSYKMDKGDKSGHMMSSSADISIFETPTFNIDNLKTSSETEIKVEYYIDNDLYWSGFVIPDFFSKTIGTPSTVEMTASDRLSTLKSVTLTGLTTRVSLRSLLVQSLAKTELSLPLTATATFTHGTTNVLDTEALSQRLVDNKGRSISCYDIIQSILIATNATLLQNGGEWVLKNKIEHEAEAASVTFDDVDAGARRTIVPVASSVGVYHEHGGGRIYPENNNFNNGLSGWTAVNGFVAAVDNRKIDFYLFGTPYPSATETVPNYLRNNNERVTAANDLDTAPYIESDSIPIVTTEADRVKLNVDISVTAPGGGSHLTDPAAYPSFVRYAVLVTDGTRVLALNRSGALETYDKTKSSEQTLLTHVKNTIDRASIAEDVSKAISAELVLGDDILSYSVKIRIYGSGTYQTVLINHAHVSFTNTVSELPKGSMYKTRQGANYTKVHDPDTIIFGDYLTGGLNGYFYNYPIDDTSSLYLPSGELSRSWTAYGDSEELPLLQHVTRQRSRLFSVAHDILRATIDVSTFNPMAVYQDCAGNKYVIVSAIFDFLRSTVDAELEQVAYGSLEKRDYIYSYFGDGEKGISSVGGISGGGTGTGGGGSGGGMTADQVAILSEVQVLAHDHGNKEVLDQVTQDVVDNALREMIISTDTETELTDENYLSSLRVLKEILDNNEYLGTQFLSKVNPDTAQEIIKFVKGIEIGTFTTGPLGAGAAIKMENGVSRMEVDQLDVRMRATFRELIIESLKHIGGQLILSPARMKCTSVVDGGTYYRCYFDTGDGKVSNEFVAGDQARCQVFTGSGVKMYWRLVTSVGTDWINLSKTDAISGSSIPEAGDDIVQLGNRSDVTRQNAQILSTVGVDAPSWKQYKGINSFSLEGKDTTVFSGTGNKISGKTVFTSNGANVEDGINSKNSNYSSQPTSYKANDTWTLSSDTTVNGIAYKAGEILTATQDSTTFVQSHWVKKVRYTDDTAVNDLQIGTRNYFKNGKVNNSVTSTLVYYLNWLSENIPAGTKVSISVRAKSSAPTNGFAQYFNEANPYVNFPDQNLTTDWKIFTLTRTLPSDLISSPSNTILHLHWNGTFTVNIDWICVVVGDKAMMSFVAAPEDVQADIETAKTEAENAAQAYADTKAEAERVLAEAYADGKVSAEEQARIDDVNAKLAAAKAHAEAQDALLKTQQEAYADGKISTAEQAAINAAKDYADLKKTEVQAYADGIVSDEEARAIADALAKFNESKAHAEQLVKDIEIGGRNLLINSKIPTSANTAFADPVKGQVRLTTSDPTYWVNKYSVPLSAGEVVTFSISCRRISGSGNIAMYLNSNNGYVPLGTVGTEWVTLKLTRTINVGVALGDILHINGVTADGLLIEWAKLERGNKATDWTPAPEDVQAAIDTEKTRINDILSDNVADPSEKQYLSNLWQEIYAEYPRIWAQANDYSVDKSNYEAKYSALNTLLSPVLANLTVNSTVSGASIRTAFSQYYDARTFLLNNITNKVNTTAADAQAKANVSKAITDTFKTTINGGLISTVITEYRELNSEQVTGLISGIQGANKNLPFLVAGGTYAEGIAGTAKAIIRHDGTSKFTDGEFNGKVTSSSDGNRVIIDPDDKSVKLIDSNDETLSNIGFKEITEGSQTFNQPYIEQLSPSAYSFTPKSFFRPSYIELTNITGFKNTSFVFDAKNSQIILGLSGSSPGTLKINIKNLPTSGSGLSAGDLYRDSNGFLKVV